MNLFHITLVFHLALVKKNLLPWVYALAPATVLNRIGQTFPYLKPLKLDLAFTIRYKVDQAVMKPVPLSTSPSRIIQPPNAKAPPNSSEEAGDGPILPVAPLKSERKEPPLVPVWIVDSGCFNTNGVDRSNDENTHAGYGVCEY